MSGSALKTIFSFTTSILVSFLHLGQNNGNLIRTVSAYIFVRVFLPHTGQLIHWKLLIFLSITRSLFSVALRYVRLALREYLKKYTIVGRNT